MSPSPGGRAGRISLGLSRLAILDNPSLVGHRENAADYGGVVGVDPRHDMIANDAAVGNGPGNLPAPVAVHDSAGDMAPLGFPRHDVSSPQAGLFAPHFGAKLVRDSRTSSIAVSSVFSRS
jgi:hypothetical protein